MISHVDTVNNTLTTLAVLDNDVRITGLAGDSNALWVAGYINCRGNGGECGTVVRVDPISGAVTAVQPMTTSDIALHPRGSLVSAGAYLYGKVTGYTPRWDSASNRWQYDRLQGVGRWSKAGGEPLLLRDGSGNPLSAADSQLGISGIGVHGSSLYVSAIDAHRIYRLQYTPPVAPSGREVYGGSNPAENTYCLRCVGKPVDLDSGAQFDATTDIAIPGRGVPLAFTRTYDTRKAAENGRLATGGATLTTGNSPSTPPGPRPRSARSASGRTTVRRPPSPPPTTPPPPACTPRRRG